MQSNRSYLVYRHLVREAASLSYILYVRSIDPGPVAIMGSILQQDACEIESVCINDELTDDSLAILQEYVHRGPRVLLLICHSIREEAAKKLGDVWASADTTVVAKKHQFIRYVASGSVESRYPCQRYLREWILRLRCALRKIRHALSKRPGT